MAYMGPTLQLLHAEEIIPQWLHKFAIAQFCWYDRSCNQWALHVDIVSSACASFSVKPDPKPAAAPPFPSWRKAYLLKRCRYFR